MRRLTRGLSFSTGVWASTFWPAWGARAQATRVSRAVIRALASGTSRVLRVRWILSAISSTVTGAWVAVRSRD